jgi:uncharacterized alkaline shock family protein YloU
METERYGVTMKGSSIDTHMGSISINNEVIAQYAGSVAVECFGIVGMTVANVRDGLARILKPDNLSRGINVTVGANHKLILDFHVIVAYGVSIIAVSDNLIGNVKYKVEEFTGLDVEKINVFVEGVRVID